MAGFHGGHSGGGGFHGGHSSGGFHGGHSSHSSYSSRGRSSVHFHTTPFIFVGGNSFNIGNNNNNVRYKRPSIIPSLIIGIIMILIGITIFFSLYTIKTEATITDVRLAKDYRTHQYYEEYTFMYQVDDKIYYGTGDDELVYYLDETYYKYSVLVGEKYPLYVKYIDNSSYSFERNNFIPYAALIFLSSIAIIIIASAIYNLRDYQKRLSKIGDLNGDGKLDEKDMEIYYTKKRNELNKQNSTTKICPYCNSIININDRFCENCGATQADN